MAFESPHAMRVAPDPALPLPRIRACGKTDDILPRVLDIAFDKDRRRTRKHHSETGAARIPKATHNRLKHTHSKSSIGRKRAKACVQPLMPRRPLAG